MTTPRLNRIFSITASSIITGEQLIPWRYSAYGAPDTGGQPATELPSLGKYAWAASLLGAHNFDNVDTSEKLTTATIPELELGRNTVNADGSENSTLPAPGDVLQDVALDGMEVRLGPALLYPDSYVRFVSSGRNDYFTSSEKYLEFFFVEVDSAITLVGDAFTLESDTDVIVNISGQTATTTVSDAVLYQGVWGEIDEQGLQQSLISTGSILVTGREQLATLTVRYDSRWLAGETVIDDLNREWRVTSSRPIRDRRYIEFELTLSVV